jgi:hypothetical protein
MFEENRGEGTPETNRLTDRNSLRIEWVVPRVEKQVLKLPASLRAKLSRIVSRSIPLAECEMVRTHAKSRIRHFRLDRNYRAYTQEVDGRTGVIFVDLHHQGERFMKLYNNKVIGRLIPIQETDFMKAQATPAQPQPALSFASAPVSSPEPPAGSTASTAEACFSVFQSIVAALAGPLVGKAEDYWMTELQNLEKSQVARAGELDEQNRRLSGQVGNLGRELASALEDISRIGRGIEAVRKEYQAQLSDTQNAQTVLGSTVARAELLATAGLDGVLSELNELRQAIIHQARTSEQIAQEYRATKEVVAALPNEVQAFINEHATAPMLAQLDTVNRELQDHSAKHESYEAQLNRVDRQAADVLARIARCLQTCEMLDDGQSRATDQIAALRGDVDSLLRRQSECEARSIKTWRHAILHRLGLVFVRGNHLGTTVR